MASRASILFDQIVNDPNPVAFIEKMVADHLPETEYLDFKTSGGDTDNKKNWSVALSGFGNTEGGVIIWGIDARGIPSPDGSGRKIDAASACKPVDYPATLAQLLKDVQLQAVVEPLTGVEIRYWEKVAGKGYVVCLVPEGGHKPYRADLESSHQYWQRVGDKFALLPHSLLRSLFYPVTQAVLRMTVRRVTGSAPYICTFSNEGTATAEAVRFRCYLDAGMAYGPTDNVHEQPPRGYREYPAPQVGQVTLHPGEFTGPFRFGLRQSTITKDEWVRVYIAAHMRDQEPQYFRLAVRESSLAVEQEIQAERVDRVDFQIRS